MTQAQSTPGTDPADQTAEARDLATNEVRLVGRVTGEPTTVELPSGDTLVTFRLSVDRHQPTNGPRASPRPQRVDSVPCIAWGGRLRRGILTWRPGDVVEVTGAVRCRFYQAGGATRSRVEVEAARARVIRRSSAA